MALSRYHKAKLTDPVEIWDAEAEWLIDYLYKLSTTISAHGLKWTQNMLRHYITKYEAHEHNAPHGCLRRAAPHRAMIRAIKRRHKL